jgi:hypothetical protein
MNKLQSFAIKATVLIVNLILLFTILYLLVSGMIIFELFLPLLFSQALIAGLLLGAYFVYKKIDILRKDIGFHFITGITLYPKIEGNYKNNWWQVHFVSRDIGAQWGTPRTYIKLQYKAKKNL